MRIGAKRIVMLLVALASSSALADTRETMEENYALFAQFAGEPVTEIRNYYRAFDWQPLGTTQLALWVNNRKNAYLIELDEPCTGLDFAKAIQVTSTQRTISARFDRVKFERQSCTIRSMRPVDYDLVRAAMRDE